MSQTRNIYIGVLGAAVLVGTAYLLLRIAPNQRGGTDAMQNTTNTAVSFKEPCRLVSSDVVNVPEGWSSYVSSDLCVAFIYPSGWELSDDPSSVGVGEPKNSRLDSNQLFGLLLFRPGTQMHELFRQDALDLREWKKIGPDTYTQSQKGQGVQIESYLHYTSDGRIYSYKFQIVSGQDYVTAQRIRESLIIR